MDTHWRRPWPLQTNIASQEKVWYRHILFPSTVPILQLWHILCRIEGLIRNGIPSTPLHYQGADECD